MKFLALIVALCAALALTACGDDGSTAATQASTTPKQKPPPKKPPGTDAEEPIAGPPKPPKVYVPSGPPPTDLVVKDLRRGSGPITRPHSRLAVHFIAVDYRSGKTIEAQWEPQQAFTFEYDHGLPMQGWEEGLVGMRVGGRRKMLVPSHLAYKEGSIVYVVDLLAVEKRPDFNR